MTGNRALLTNFVEKFLGTVRFGNNDFSVIAGYGDVGLEVAFRKSTCFVRNEDGVDLLTVGRSSNLYTISLNEVASNSLTCLLAKASSSQSWLWHQHEASEVIISFIKKTQVNLQIQVQRVRTNNGTEFKNKTLAKFFDEEDPSVNKINSSGSSPSSSIGVSRESSYGLSTMKSANICPLTDTLEHRLFFLLLGICLIENALKLSEDPSINKINSSGSSPSSSIGVSRESSYGLSTMKSANICPLTDTL
nr:integrase, catalytic region, zinc finger, CCHC-type, peptidase aspartic, catalytic [Tanacetum cinerariifolium]